VAEQQRHALRGSVFPVRETVPVGQLDHRGRSRRIHGWRNEHQSGGVVATFSKSSPDHF